MGIWNLYFLIKFALMYYGIINFDVIKNAAFFALLVIAVPSTPLTKIKLCVCVVIAIALFYIELFAMNNTVEQHSIDNTLILLKTLFNFDIVLIVFTLSIVYWYLSQWVRFTSVTLILFVIAAIYGQSYINSIQTTVSSDVVELKRVK
nr:cellulose biosynthesis protein BcsG [Pseudoalteromonas sp. MMG010]